MKKKQNQKDKKAENLINKRVYFIISAKINIFLLWVSFLRVS